LNNNNYINGLTIDVSGGRGGNMQSMPSGGLVGPGGAVVVGVFGLNKIQYRQLKNH